MPTATGAASLGGASRRRRIKREQNTGRSENDPDVQPATPHQQDQRNGDTPAAPPTHPTTRSIGSIQFQSNRTRSLPCPAAAASQVVEWRWRIDMEFLAEKSKSKSPGEQGICSARPLSVLSLSLMFVQWSRSRPSHHSPRMASPRRLLAANNQSPTLHARPARGHEPDRSIAPSMSLLRLGRLPFVSYSYHYQPGRACSHAISQPRTRSCCLRLQCMRRFLTAATVDDVL